jgi:hypothetical protein
MIAKNTYITIQFSTFNTILNKWHEIFDILFYYKIHFFLDDFDQLWAEVSVLNMLKTILLCMWSILNVFLTHGISSLH